MKATQNDNYFDTTFKKNWEASHKVNLIRGAYHFFSPKFSAESQFENYKRNVKLVSNDLPPILDVEWMSVDMNEVKKWLILAENYYGVKPIIYSSYTFYLAFMKGKFDNYPLWLFVNGNLKMRPNFSKNECIILQYNQGGKVEGIKGDVDLDVFIGNEEQFKKLLIK